MSMTIIDNFSLKGKSFMDGRQSVATLAALKAVPETDIPDGFRAYCTATRLWYEFNSSNSVDATLGRWRGINSSADARTDAKIKAAVTDKLGKPNGIAVLDETGQINAQYLPAYVDDIIDLDGFVSSVTATAVTNNGAAANAEYTHVWYDTANKRIVTNRGSGTPYYYWAAGEIDDESAVAGRFRRVMYPGGVPMKSKIYVNAADGKIYRWSGTAMVEISKSLALGAVEGTGNVVTSIKVENGVIKPVKSTTMVTEEAYNSYKSGLDAMITDHEEQLSGLTTGKANRTELERLEKRVSTLEAAEPDSIPAADIVALFA